MSNEKDFVIENGVLTKYTGEGGDVVIPDGVTSIGQYAFDRCTSILSLVIPDSVTIIGQGAFRKCEALESVNIPEGVTKIGWSTFEYCSSLKAIVIPESVKQIGQQAFFSCKSLRSVFIPEGVEKIEDGAFRYCASLEEITVAESNQVYRSSGNCLIDTSHIYSAVKGEREMLIQGCKNSGIPDDESVKIIYEYAFIGCTGLEQIEIPGCIKTIEKSAFDGCTSLKSVSIPDSVTSIGVCAFNYCTSLKSVSIPDSVTSIGVRAFYGCSSLEKLSVGSGIDDVKRIGKEAFAGVKLDTLIYKKWFPFYEKELSPEVICYAGEYKDLKNKNLKIKAIIEVLKGNPDAPVPSEDDVKVIDDFIKKNNEFFIFDDSFASFAGYMCEKKLLTLDSADKLLSKDLSPEAKEKLTAYKEGSFSTKDKEKQQTKTESGKTTVAELKKLWAIKDIDDSTVEITAYKGKEDAIEIPAKVGKKDVVRISHKIGTPFGEMKKITVPYGIKIIDFNSFSTCKSLESIVISDSVDKISEKAFTDCSALESIVVSEGNAKYRSSENCIIETETKKLIAGCKRSVIPSDGSVTKIGNGAFYGSGSLESITIPEGVIEIGIEAFRECVSLRSIALSNSVTKIGSLAFCGCESLTSITIPGCVKEISSRAFTGCKSLKSVVVPEGVTKIEDGLFYSCKSLASIIIPDSVTEIGREAFCGCESLTSIVIPDNVKSIGPFAFDYCNSLSSITIPDSVTEIGPRAIPGFNVTTIRAHAGSYAEQYAKSQFIKFEEI